jgi:hypothetical protein
MSLNQKEITRQLISFIDNLITCPKCGTMEIPTSFKNLPSELKIHWAHMPRKSLYLHCKRCDEWDLIKPREKVF